MPIIESEIDTQSEEYRQSRDQMLELVNQFRSIEQKVIAKAEKARPKFEKRKQLLPRERLERLLDP